MATHRRRPIRWRGRLPVLGLWFVLLALVVGDSSPTGCSDHGKEDGGAESGQERGRLRTSSADPNQTVAAGPEQQHSAFWQRVEERRRMVRYQIEVREVRDPNVLEAMRTVPRHAFVPESQEAYAYEDRPLYIGHGQTISQPYVVAFMTEALELEPDSVVLEIGTGSGYQAAVCAEIAKEVYTIEIVEPLAESAAALLKELSYANVHVRAGDGYYGWPEKGPFDAIIGTAAAGEIPLPLIEQLRTGGRMILPVGDTLGLQSLILVTKDEQGQLRCRDVMPVRFVPMTGRIQQP